MADVNEQKERRSRMIDAVMKAQGNFIITSGENSEVVKSTGSILPIVPWLVMDAQYCVFHEHVENLKLRQNAKRLRNEWERSYWKFNHRFWKNIDDDTASEVVDFMDDYFDFVNNDVVRLKLAVMNEIPHDDTDVRLAIAAGYVCQVFALIAQSLYGRVFRRVEATHVDTLGKRMHYEWKPAVSRDISVVERSAMEWYSEFSRVMGVKYIPLSDNIQALNGVLCRRTVQWLKLKDNEIK